MGTGQKVPEHIRVSIRKKLNHRWFNPKLPGDGFALPQATGVVYADKACAHWCQTGMLCLLPPAGKAIHER